MNLILTHEHADFDAIASLVGASLLDNQAIPVLPRRINRNVRAFIMLYGKESVFVHPRDLPQRNIESITLVDTQSLSAIRGVDERTYIRVVDHHKRRDTLAPNWDITSEVCGAITTYFVEKIREIHKPVSPLQATLLLLGIYEDTGSLTYSNTTPRDMRAAAYLMEQNASLTMATDFLNAPISQKQRQLYDQLAAKAKSYNILGHRVIVACCDGNDINDELSSISEKLGLFFDSDALFILVSGSDGIQVIARSTSDKIDVAAVVVQLGGSGHERAASAYIKFTKAHRKDTIAASSKAKILDETCGVLLSLLQHYVIPATTVGQIMSHDREVVTSTTSVEELAKLMQRSHYDSYPVVENGKVIGLLKSGTIERSISSHTLHEIAANLMEVGPVTVYPDDSLPIALMRMADCNCRQIPVVDEGTGTVLGTISSIDLLKAMYPFYTIS